MNNIENALSYNDDVKHAAGSDTAGRLANEAIHFTDADSQIKKGIDAAKQVIRDIDQNYHSDLSNPKYAEDRLSAGLNLVGLLLKEKDSRGHSSSLPEATEEFRKDLGLAKQVNNAGNPWIKSLMENYADQINGNILANDMQYIVLAAKSGSDTGAADTASVKLSCGMSQSYTQASLDLATDIVKHRMKVDVVRDENMSVRSIDFGDGIYLRKPGENQTQSCSKERIAQYANPPMGFRRSTGSVFVDTLLLP